MSTERALAYPVLSRAHFICFKKIYRIYRII